MGKGQRHSKNAGVMGSETLTYAERNALGFGTVKERLGKDSQGNYDDCCLTLQHAQDPVVTSDGYLFSREAIVANLLSQKRGIKRKMAAWGAEQKELQQQELDRHAAAKQAKLVAFDRQNHMGLSEDTARVIQSAIEQEAAHMHEAKVEKSTLAIRDHQERLKDMKAFWLPGSAPDVRAASEKPDSETTCPASGKKLRYKDLIPVRFTPASPEDLKQGHIDPVTKDAFTNTARLVVLKSTGDVMLRETYEKCVKPEGNYNGVAVREADVVALKSGGTGFAGRDGDKVQARKHFPLGPGSGRADLRGQHQGPRSLGGLIFYN